MARISLDAIVFDAGTQIRAAINEATVTEYAERMTEGVQFPPIVLFHDGNQHYLADGFHRLMAAKRNQFRDIEAEIHAGTTQDALWFALGANKANGQRLTEADKQHAVRLALTAWPDKMQREIAQQVGCHQSLVSEVYRKTTVSEPVLRGRALMTERKKDAVRALISSGSLGAEQIAKEAKVSRSLVTDVRAEMGLSRLDKSKAAVADRRARMREMAAEGYSSRQIAAELGLSENGCRETLKREGIAVPADMVTGNTKRHDSNRIVERMVMDAEHLCADVNLIEFSDLDLTQLATWLDSLNQSRNALGMFIRRLMKEQQKHGEAA